MILIAVDPGVTTGNRIIIINSHGIPQLDKLAPPGKWCVADPDYTGGYSSVVEQDRFPFLARMEHILRLHVDAVHFQVERFTITSATAKKGAQPEPLYVIGALMYLAEKYNATLDMSLPSQVMKLFPDPVLKTLGLFTKGKGHANDAARHAAFYLLNHDLITYDDMYGTDNQTAASNLSADGEASAS